jgi:hypothetical protein
VSPTPERALRLALVGWGLGDLAMGRRRSGMAWLALEIVALAILTAATLLLADTTWYLLPFLLGVAFLVAWAGKAVTTYRRARALQGAAPTAPHRSPAATIAWLAGPLLAWGTGFWLVAAERATPAAVVDRFVSHWSELEPMSPVAFERLGGGPFADREAAQALYRLQQLCDAGQLPDDCGEATENLLRDVRFTVTERDATHATAEAELVEFRRRPSTLFGIFEGSELVPFPIASVLELRLEARPAALGSREWVIVNATAL